MFGAPDDDSPKILRQDPADGTYDWGYSHIRLPAADLERWRREVA